MSCVEDPLGSPEEGAICRNVCNLIFIFEFDVSENLEGVFQPDRVPILYRLFVFGTAFVYLYDHLSAYLSSNFCISGKKK